MLCVCLNLMCMYTRQSRVANVTTNRRVTYLISSTNSLNSWYSVDYWVRDLYMSHVANVTNESDVMRITFSGLISLPLCCSLSVAVSLLQSLCCSLFVAASLLQSLCCSLCDIIVHSEADRIHTTEWRRPIGCLKLQVIFRKRATNYRLFCRKWPIKITCTWYIVAKTHMMPYFIGYRLLPTRELYN